jgi:hypothetical protein
MLWQWQTAIDYVGLRWQGALHYFLFFHGFR